MFETQVGLQRGKPLPLPLPSHYSPPGLSYRWWSLLSRTAQQQPLPRALTHFSHRASGVKESASSGSQLLVPFSKGSLDPKAFLSPRGRSDSNPSHLNLKLHKRKPSQRLLQLPLPSRTLPRKTPKYQEPPKSYLPLTWAPLAAASSEGRPPKNLRRSRTP